jgi:ATP-binding cassette subfamily B multidrug efflux pump
MFARLLGWLERRIDVFEPFDDKTTPPNTVWGFMWFYMSPFRRLLTANLAFATVIGLIEASMLLVVGRFIDLLTRSSPERLIPDHGLTLVAIAALVLVARPLVVICGEALLNQSLVTPVYSRVRWRTHLYTLGHALSYFQNDFAGRLSNRVMQAGPSVQLVAIEVLDTMAYVAVYAAVALIAFSAIHPVLAVPIAIWIGLYALLVRFYVPRAVELSQKQSDARSALTGRIVDSYTNILTVKLFARADQERSAVRAAIEKHTRLGLDNLRLLTVTMARLVLMNTALIGGTAVVATWLWTGGQMSVGEIAAGLALVLRMNDMSRWVMQVVRSIFENLGTVQESMETISKPHELNDAPTAKPLVVTRGEIRFEGVGFHYGKGAGVIENLDLVIAPGEKVGIVGPSGAGKSTLVSLLLRLYDVEKGRIRVDGQDIAAVTQDSLRNAIGVVTQDNALLHRSIEDNIAYGNPNATREQIERAARLAEAHGFIASLADKDGREGYASRVGERGVKLSGGQRQRIAIARVLLKDAPILVLDEATSALDSEVEAAIQESLERLMQGKTVIAIAHRLSTIAALDRLVVMDAGRIVEQGSHAELVAAGGLYARLWARQSGGFLGGFDEAKRQPIGA